MSGPPLITKREYYKADIPPGEELMEFASDLLKGEKGAMEWIVNEDQTVIYIHVMNGNRGAAARLDVISENDFREAQNLRGQL